MLNALFSKNFPKRKEGTDFHGVLAFLKVDLKISV